MTETEPVEPCRGSRAVPWRIIVGVPLLVLALGIVTDVCMGFPLGHKARSAGGWLAGVVGFGALYLVGEGACEWLGSRDKVTDPLWVRALHLGAMLALWGALVIGVVLSCSCWQPAQAACSPPRLRLRASW
jgi:hypothetical protein